VKQYEIIYKHRDMRPDYRGYALKWGNDTKSVAKLFSKKNSYIQITEVNEIHTSK